MNNLDDSQSRGPLVRRIWLRLILSIMAFMFMSWWIAAAALRRPPVPVQPQTSEERETSEVRFPPEPRQQNSP